ncbi:hypothetical protein JY97_01440 [Alkalispirochaeta odontotermitis]|nr:hypothetical protein JY97_01440 [Alkalispirochaeta odontotermitis]CAB1083374.1 hypothetical protein D1AOALGA4SA_10944 [Olavius algarvensis Delta 1 endosymbiont]
MANTIRNNLSPADQKALKNQTISEKKPGSILADFETLLNFIGPEGIPVSGRRHYFPLRVLPEINAQMTQPLEIDLKRPLQKSYPHINGLYYLLRITGMVYLERTGNKYKLVVDDGLKESWLNLNFTERYFTLLEAWVVRGHIEIAGEFHGFSHSPFMDSHFFLKEVIKKELKVNGNPDAEKSLPYVPGFFALAQMELFGLISVEHLKPAAGKGWNIKWLRPTRFGDAVVNLLTGYFRSEDYYMTNFDPQLPGFGVLQPLAKPLFPEWRNNLAAPETIILNGTYIFRVSIGKSKRWIAVSSSMLFEDLCQTILDAFDFDYDHLYQFQFKDRYGLRQNINHPFMDDEPPWTDDTRIGEAMIHSASQMTFVYDFGDNWEFDVTLERIDPVDENLKEPKIIKSVGEPPEQYRRWEY